MADYAILDKDHSVIEIDNVIEWGMQFEIANRRVDETKIGDIRISTVFLGIDHTYGKGPPLWFETMIFGGKHDQFQDRCSTWSQAIELHKAAVMLVKIEED